MNRYGIARLLALLAVLLWGGAALAAGMEGKRAPAFSLADLQGKAHTLAEAAAGRPTIVLFWASWCPYCKALLPRLQALRARYGDRVGVIAINVWEDEARAAVETVRAGGYDFTVLYHGDKEAAKWGVKGTPGLFVLDAEGRIVFDRNARPLTTADLGDDGGKGPVNEVARSADLWAQAVATTLEHLLPAPTPVH